MRDIAPHPPGRVILIAWLALAAGLVKLVALPIFVGALRDEAAFLSSGASPSTLSPEWLAGLARFVAGHLRLFVAFWMILGLVMMVAAAGLLLRKAWARAGLEIVCWFGLVEAPLVAAFIYSVRRMVLSLKMAAGDALASSLVSRFWAALAWGGVYLILLVLLRRAPAGDPTQ